MIRLKDFLSVAVSDIIIVDDENCEVFKIKYGHFHKDLLSKNMLDSEIVNIEASGVNEFSVLLKEGI